MQIVFKNSNPTPQKVHCVFRYAGQVTNPVQENSRRNTRWRENEEFLDINSYNTRGIHMGHAQAQVAVRPLLTAQAGVQSHASNSDFFLSASVSPFSVIPPILNI